MEEIMLWLILIFHWAWKYLECQSQYAIQITLAFCQSATSSLFIHFSIFINIYFHGLWVFNPDYLFVVVLEWLIRLNVHLNYELPLLKSNIKFNWSWSRSTRNLCYNSNHRYLWTKNTVSSWGPLSHQIGVMMLRRRGTSRIGAPEREC